MALLLLLLGGCCGWLGALTLMGALQLLEEPWLPPKGRQ